MIKLQCENCFASLEPQSPHLYKCLGCGVSYLLEKGEVTKYIPPWNPEGYVECPDGTWKPYCLYYWKSPIPPFERTIGFLSQNWKKDTILAFSELMLCNYNRPFIAQQVRQEVMKAIEEVLPPGFNKYDADLSHIFRELDFLTTMKYNSKYSLSRKD